MNGLQIIIYFQNFQIAIFNGQYTNDKNKHVNSKIGIIFSRNVLPLKELIQTYKEFENFENS